MSNSRPLTPVQLPLWADQYQAKNGTPLSGTKPPERLIIPTPKNVLTGLSRRNYTPESVRGVLNSSGVSGTLQLQMEMFRAMEDSWPRLGKNVHEVKSAVQNTEWQIMPFMEKGEKPTESAQEMASFIERALYNMRPNLLQNENDFDQTLYDLLDAMGKGLSVLEILWDKNKAGEILPRATRWVNPQYYGHTFAMDQLDTLLVDPAAHGYFNPGSAQEFPPDKFLIGVYRTGSGDRAADTALYRKLAPWWMYTTYATEWMVQYAQLFGLPFRKGKYRAGDPQAKKDIAEMLANMGAAGWGAFPEGTDVEFIDAGKNAGTNPQAWLIEKADAYCDQMILGQTLTSNEGDKGSRSLGEVHERIRADRIMQCAYWAAEVINKQLIPSIVRLNYGEKGLAEMPSLTPQQASESPETAATRLKTVVIDMGLPVTKQYAYEKLGIPMPGEGDELLFSEPEPLVEDFSSLASAAIPEDVRQVLAAMPPALRNHYQSKILKSKV